MSCRKARRRADMEPILRSLRAFLPGAAQRGIFRASAAAMHLVRPGHAARPFCPPRHGPLYNHTASPAGCRAHVCISLLFYPVLLNKIRSRLGVICRHFL